MGEGSATIDRDAPFIELADRGLRPATAEDIGRLKAVMAEAFFEDPIYGWLMPDDTKRPARLRRYFAIELRHLGLARGRVWTKRDLTGAALSLPPGAWRSPLHITLLEGSAFGVHVDRAATLGAAMEWRHMREMRERGTTTSVTSACSPTCRARVSAAHCCVRRSSAATGRACPPTSRPQASATLHSTSASASSSSTS